MQPSVTVFTGDSLARYSFGEAHPFGPMRHQAFVDEFHRQGLDSHVQLGTPVPATQEQIEWFHDPAYVERVKQASLLGQGFLDQGDTPAFIGVYDAAATVAGTTLAALDSILNQGYQRAFVPIAGLHHARRDSAAGFCVFNDCGIAIEALRRVYNISRIAYVDIDAHHGDGVFYSYETDPELFFVDIHEDGHFLYPGTGMINETGKGNAIGTKLNIPMPMYANDEQFYNIWPSAEKFLEKAQPEIILFQCGADSLAGDPITHMQYTQATHAYAAQQLCSLADRFCNGRILAMGGGGYNLVNLAQAWCAVVNEFIRHSPQAS